MSSSSFVSGSAPSMAPYEKFIKSGEANVDKIIVKNEGNKLSVVSSARVSFEGHDMVIASQDSLRLNKEDRKQIVGHFKQALAHKYPDLFINDKSFSIAKNNFFKRNTNNLKNAEEKGLSYESVAHITYEAEEAALSHAILDHLKKGNNAFQKVASANSPKEANVEAAYAQKLFEQAFKKFEKLQEINSDGAGNEWLMSHISGGIADAKECVKEVTLLKDRHSLLTKKRANESTHSSSAQQAEIENKETSSLSSEHSTVIPSYEATILERSPDLTPPLAVSKGITVKVSDFRQKDFSVEKFQKSK